MGETPKYTAEDLLIDDKFLEWIHSNQQQHDKYWQDRLLHETPLRAAFDQAKEMTLALSAQQQEVDPSMALKRLNLKINKPIKLKPQRVWMKIAATIALLMSISWIFWPENQSFQTAYGEIQTISLPDGTVVTLRANSNLWWDGDWDDNDKRVVFLEGEAYFDVRPTAELERKRPFVVHAKPIEVEVLGTEFNLVNRSTRTQVVLVEGKIAVKAKDQKTYELKPQQKYAWYSNGEQASIETVDTKLYTDWQQQIWRFENTNLSVVAQMLMDHFGKTVVFANPRLKNRKLNGSAPASSLETLLSAIKTSLNITVINNNDQIIFDN